MNLSNLKNFDLDQLQNSFKGLDPENIGSWPLAARGLVWILIVVVIGLGGYVAFVSDKTNELDTARQEEATKKQEFENKAFKSANVAAYKKQLKDMEDSFGALLRQLPKDTEVPGLLEDITHTGVGSGLEFETIDLQSEKTMDFYAELPIKIRVKGDYHSFGGFVSGLAALPRIVTLHDFKISPLVTGKKAGDFGPPILEMEITAKTYRYVDKGDKDKGNKSEAGKK